MNLSTVATDHKKPSLIFLCGARKFHIILSGTTIVTTKEISSLKSLETSRK